MWTPTSVGQGGVPTCPTGLRGYTSEGLRVNRNTSSAAPVIAATILLAPMLYVGSYYCLVDTNCNWPSHCNIGPVSPTEDLRYRVAPIVCSRVYWPIEKIDRKLRPAAWEDPLVKIINEIEPTP